MTTPVSPSSDALTRRVIDAALAEGFVRVGIATARPSEPAADRLAAWLAAGHHGEMQYMAGGLNRACPTELLPSARSLLVVALPYGDGPIVHLRRDRASLAPLQPLRGRVARYAQGTDYHVVLRRKLERLGQVIEELAGRPLERRACVDSAPLLERDFAVRAGLGFAAKSTLTIVPGVGSFVLLGELLLDLALEPTPEFVGSGCGSCSACLTACPTGAFVAPHVLDARRCISYLTIELKGSVPREHRRAVGQHVFGCDICQDVCPWNRSRHAPTAAPELARRPELAELDLVELLFLTSSGYRRLVRGTALSRVSRARLSRNAAIALGNSAHPSAEEPLATAVRSHSSALVREHAAWALGELSRSFPLVAGRAALENARERDADDRVRAEAALALAEHG